MEKMYPDLRVKGLRNLKVKVWVNIRQNICTFSNKLL